MKTRLTAASLVVAFAALAPAGEARAETFDTCSGFITSVPTTITTQGTWCMDRDLSSALASGALITVNVNNVTIDCNDFKLGGLAAGPATAAVGIRADNRANITVRNCNIRGFMKGISLTDLNSAGHRVIGNKFDGNTYTAIEMQGSGHAIRGNVIVDTGGASPGDITYGMYLAGDYDILDNTIDGVSPAVVAPVGSVGIAVLGSDSTVIQGNRIRNVLGGAGFAYGVATLNANISVEDNHFSTGDGGGTVAAIICNGTMIVAGNRYFEFPTSPGCPDDGGNIEKVVP